MIYLAHTAHWQFLGLIFGLLSWILIMVSTGVNEWRLWYVHDHSVVTSGVAWVGIWRACFYSHTLPKLENCWSIGLTDSYAPLEISLAQVLMVLAVVSGLAGNVCGALAVRMVYFTVLNRRRLRLLFVLAGLLYVLTGALCLVATLWNMSSVLKNNSIAFPAESHLHPAPVKQQVGSGIAVGTAAGSTMLVCGLVFLCYRHVWKSLKVQARPEVTTPPDKSEIPNGFTPGHHNPAFCSEEAS